MSGEPTSRSALVTIAAGRHDHLRRQIEGVDALDLRPALHVIVSMGDAELPRVVAECRPRCETRVVPLDAGPSLPLAAARNLGAEVARAAGADLLILLDVDCIPHPRLTIDYADALRTLQETGHREPVVVCGQIWYLPELPPGQAPTPDRWEELGTEHPVRVSPPAGELIQGDVNLLWSLNFAMSTTDWVRVGGFDEAYLGYGGEDTDFGHRLAAAGGTMWWFGGGWVAHQYHSSEDPPVRHLRSIVTNANLFHERWGSYPMGGWLAAFREQGLARFDGGRWQVVADPDERP